MRTILGARVLHWAHASVSRSWKRVSHRTPDVICELSDLGVVTLEYDYGKYTKETILRKAETARRMTRHQVWGTTSMRRAEFIASALPDAEVWVVSWETGECTLVSSPLGGTEVQLPPVPVPVENP